MLSSEVPQSDRSVLRVLLASVLIVLLWPYVAPMIWPELAPLQLIRFAPRWWQLLFPVIALVLPAGCWVLAARRENSQVVAISAVVISLAVLVVLSADSLLPGAGTLRVAQVGQQEYPVFHWFERGGLALGYGWFALLHTFVTPATTAAIWGWRLCSITACLSGLILCWQLLRTTPRSPETTLLLISCMGIGLAPLLLQTASPELLLVPLALVVVLLTDASARTGKVIWIGAIWVVGLLGVALHWSGIGLLPGLLAATFVRDHRFGLKSSLLFLLGCGTIVGIIFSAGAADWLFRYQFVGWQGSVPVLDMSLFSLRHILEKGNLILASIPALVVVVLLPVRLHGKLPVSMQAAIGMSAGWLTVLLLRQPHNGSVIDFPLLWAHLIPLLLCSLLLIGEAVVQRVINAALVAPVALGIVLAPLGSLGVARSFDWYQQPVMAYAQVHPSYARQSYLALRDAAFASGRIDAANQFQAELPIRADDFLLFRGCNDLVLAGDYSGAIADLSRLIVRFPAWAEARFMAVTAYQASGQLARARAQLDTCLMISPGEKAYLIADYRLLVAERNSAKAGEKIELARLRFSSDKIVAADLARYWLENGNHEQARRLSDSLLAVDSTVAGGWLVKAELAAAGNERLEARRLYLEYLKWTSLPAERALAEARIRELSIPE